MMLNSNLKTVPHLLISVWYGRGKRDNNARDVYSILQIEDTF